MVPDISRCSGVREPLPGYQRGRTRSEGRWRGSPEHQPPCLREGERGDERDGRADRNVPEEPAAVADVAEPLARSICDHSNRLRAVLDLAGVSMLANRA
jgi:hypothetical protein